MKKYLVSLMVFLIVLLMSSQVFAFTPPPRPANGWYIVDLAEKLTPDQMKSLNSKIESINKTSKNEIGALILNNMDGAIIEDVAQATFDSWKVGKSGLDNGVLVVISVQERRSRIQTGKGVEGDLTDIQSKNILDNNLAPHLKKGDFFAGLSETVDVINATLESRATQSTEPIVTNNGGKSNKITWIILGSGLLIFAICFFISKRREKQYNRMFSYTPSIDRHKEALISNSVQNNYTRTMPTAVKPSVFATKSPIPSYPNWNDYNVPTSNLSNEKEVYGVTKTSNIAAPIVAAVGIGAIAAIASSSKDKEDRLKKARQEEENRYQREKNAREARERQERAAREKRDREYNEARNKKSNSWTPPAIIPTPSWSSPTPSYSPPDTTPSYSPPDTGGGFGGGDSSGGGASSGW